MRRGQNVVFLNKMNYRRHTTYAGTAFQDVYTKFKLHFYQNIFQRFATREATLFTSLILLAVAIAVELVVLSVIRVRTNKKAAE